MGYLERNIQLNFTAFADDGSGTCYASANSFNGLFEVDMGSRRCKYLGRFPMEPISKRFLFLYALRYENRIVFIPNTADYIAVYDTVTGDLVSISVEIELASDQFASGKFACAAAYGKNVYIVGRKYPYVLCLNMDTYKLRHIELDAQEPEYSGKGLVVLGDTLLLPAYNIGRVLEFNMRTERHRVYELPSDFRGASAMCADERGMLWIAPYYAGNPVLKWNARKGILERLDAFPSDLSMKNHRMFSSAFYRDGEVWLIPEKANMSLRIDAKSGMIRENESFPRLSKEKRIFGFAYDGKCYLEKRLLTQKAAQPRTNPYVELDTVTWEQRDTAFLLSEGLDRYLEDYFDDYREGKNNVSQETFSGVRLSDFLEYHAGAR